MIVTIHQPNLFPWLGFFDKMRCADVFVLLDVAPFSKGSFQNRVQVKNGTGTQWLTVPVLTKGRTGQLTLDVEVNNTRQWQREHLGTLRANYSRSPGFPGLRPALEEIYARRYQRLVDFTVVGIQMVRGALSISTPLVFASSLLSGEDLGGSRLLATLVSRLDGDTYLSGPSGKAYLDESVFTAQSIEVEYHSFEPLDYRQDGLVFKDGLSVLDLLAQDPEAAERWADAE